jgi:hypothetical protein
MLKVMIKQFLDIVKKNASIPMKKGAGGGVVVKALRY